MNKGFSFRCKQRAQGGFFNPDSLRGPIIFSFVIHVVLLLAFSASDWIADTKVLVKPKELKYIKAVVVNKQGKIAPKVQEATVKAEDDRVKQIRRKEQQQKQLAEQERIAAKKAEKEKLDEEKAKKDKAEKDKLTQKEQEKKAALEAEKAAQKAKKKAKQEALKKDEEKAKQAKLKEQERIRKEALAKQRNEREAQMQKIREARTKQEALVKKREELENRREQAFAEQDAPIIGEYEAHIQNKIGQAWSRPLSARNGMQVTLQINLIPGGDVTNVKVIKSSGDDAFDSSASQAVWKASPLPVPKESGVFTRNYRVFNLLFSPEDLWQ